MMTASAAAYRATVIISGQVHLNIKYLLPNSEVIVRVV